MGGGRGWDRAVARGAGARGRVKESPGCPTLEGEGVNRVANRFLSLGSIYLHEINLICPTHAGYD